MSVFFVLTPSHRCDGKLAIAAARAGEIGIVDLAFAERDEAQRAIREVEKHAGTRGLNWGVRWDAWGDKKRSVAALKEIFESSTPYLVLAGVSFDAKLLNKELRAARTFAQHVFLEVSTLPQALAAEEAGFDGVILKGHEAGGRVGPESTYILLQRVHQQLKIPYYVQGGMAPDTAAAAFVAGASGVVLCEQVWLAVESPFEGDELQSWTRLDGSETAVIGEQDVSYRVFCRGNREPLDEFERLAVDGQDWQGALRSRMIADSKRVERERSFINALIPLSPDVAFARQLADDGVTVAGIIEVFKSRIEENLRRASTDLALAPNGPLAKKLKTTYPILQGPMTRVSDVAPFCGAVADNGGLPFLALALLRGHEVRALLNETKALLGDKSWGVGILGFVPAELRNEQLAVVHEVCPPFAIVAGGRPSQAKQLEERGISTFLHVPSPGLLEAFIQDGCRKFIFEGRECGGHVGPRNSFVLWQSAVNVLATLKVARPDEFQIIFAGGVHDGLSAAMVAAMAAPLTARGMKIGVLMGTAYLFTHEAVDCGAILPGFQEQAVGCAETVLLKTGVGHETRCSQTPFADEFNATRKSLVQSGGSSEDIRNELEGLNLGRLRIASKGLSRREATEPGQKGDIYKSDAADQLNRGMYMIGQVATLRDQTVPMQALHVDVSQSGIEVLQAASRQPLPWQQTLSNGHAASNGHTAKKNGAAKKRRANGQKSKHTGTGDIAIVGMAGVFPKAPNVRTFWENIVRGIDAFRDVPEDRWRQEDYFVPGGTQPDRVYSKSGAFLEGVPFDPMEWLIPPASLPSIDPTQLIALVVSRQALVDAGYDRRKFQRDRMGVVFAASGSSDMELQYGVRTMSRHYISRLKGVPKETTKLVIQHLEEMLPPWTEDSFAGFLHNVIAGRVTNRLNLGGPNFVVDAACASSLTAVQTAVEHLRSGASDAMIVGASDLTNNPLTYMCFAQTHALSPTGRPRPFDQSADGIAPGECVAALVLKRVADAERDGDKIYALIKGIGSSSDGKARSMTSPDPNGQMAALKRSYSDGGVDPATVTLIEAHATGTSVGDGAEVTSLKKFFMSPTNAGNIAVGSIKSMIGHTKSAAGLASFVKTVMALDQKVLPPTLGVQKPLALLESSDCPLYVNSESRPWLDPVGGHPRRAGINSFGFGGTNFHVILEEYTNNFHPQFDVDLVPRSSEVFFWSGANATDISGAIGALQQRIVDSPANDLAQLAYSAHLDARTSRNAKGLCRLGIVATSVDDLRGKLARAVELLAAKSSDAASGIYYSEASPIDAKDVCFLYPGAGSQSVNMLRELANSNRWSHGWFARFDAAFEKDGARPVSRAIYPAPVFTDEARQSQLAELSQPGVCEAALGAVEVFATLLLERFGVRPAQTLGQGCGETVARWADGTLSFDQLLELLAKSNSTSANDFETRVNGLVKNGARLFLEVGPGDNLSSVTKAATKNQPECAAVAIATGGDAWFNFAGALLQSAVLGIPVKLEAWFENRGLKDLSTTEYVAEAKRQSTPKPSDWILTATRAKPVTEQPKPRIETPAVAPKAPIVATKAPIVPNNAPIVATDKPLPAHATNGSSPKPNGLVRKPIDLFASSSTAPRTPEAVQPIPKISSADGASPAPIPAQTPNGQPQLIPQRSVIQNQIDHSLPAISSRSIQMSENQTPAPVASEPAQDYAAAPAIPGDYALCFQNTMAYWLEWQASQTRLLERFLNLQERMLGYGSPAVLSAAPALPAIPMPAPRPAPIAYAPPVAPPPAVARPVEVAPTRSAVPVPQEPLAPALPRVVAPEIRNGNGSHVAIAPAKPAAAPIDLTVPAPAKPAPAIIPQPTPKAVAPAPQPVAQPVVAASQNGHSAEEVPTTDDFRDALLAAVSLRTGYPIDVLDEDTPLEAGLGVDSIKTVEIFSNLKKFHFFFRAADEDDEEMLLQFSQLKTLRSIIDSYDERRRRFLVPGATAVATV